ncbi:MAG: DUF2971 domain-containing protein [Gallionella sp.]
MAGRKTKVFGQISTMSFYKFRPISRYLIESIVTPCIYFSKPAELNDPFDCQLNIKSLFEDERFSTDVRLIDVKQRFERHGFFNDFPPLPGFSEHGIFCVSKSEIVGNESETLMWSHYADQHKGVRLKYDLIPTSCQEFSGVTAHTDVFYDSDSQLIEFLLESDKCGYEFYSEFCNRYLTVKHPAWKYEQEYRFFRPHFGSVRIPPACLLEVCFGLNTSPADIRLITEYASKYCGCTTFKEKVRGNGLFDSHERELTI